MPNSELKDLIGQIGAAVGRHDPSPACTASSIALVLKGFLTVPDLLDPSHLEPDPDGYRTNVIHVAPDRSFSIVSLVWLAGQRTPIHSHRCWCVVGVLRGQEYETLYDVRGHAGHPILQESGNQVHEQGSTTWLVPPGDVHRVENNSDELAVSIHVYGTAYTKHASSVFAQYQDEAVCAPASAGR